MFSPLFVLVNNLAALQAIFVRTFFSVLGAPVMNWFSNNRTVYLLSVDNLKLIKDSDGVRRHEFVLDTATVSKEVVKVKSGVEGGYLIEKPSDTWLRDKRGMVESMLLSYKKPGDSKIYYSKLSVKGVRKELETYVFKAKFGDSDSEYYGDIESVRLSMYLINDANDANWWWNRNNLPLYTRGVDVDSESDSE